MIRELVEGDSPYVVATRAKPAGEVKGLSRGLLVRGEVVPRGSRARDRVPKGEQRGCPDKEGGCADHQQYTANAIARLRADLDAKVDDAGHRK